MDLQPYVDRVRHELGVAAAAGGPDAEALAERLTAPLDSAIRLALLEACSDAAEEITRDLAPRSVEVRLRGRDPEFTVSAGAEADRDHVHAVPESDDGGTWRVTLRLPESLRAPVDAAAGSVCVGSFVEVCRTMAEAAVDLKFMATARIDTDTDSRCVAMPVAGGAPELCVIAGHNITVVEGGFDNPAEDPRHCPPVTTQVFLHAGHAIRGIRLHYAT